MTVLLDGGEDLAPAAFNEGLRLKIDQLKKFKIVLVLFYFPNIMYQLYIGVAIVF